jgi:tetratricopeptide (TPR) repeat protein
VKSATASWVLLIAFFIPASLAAQKKKEGKKTSAGEESQKTVLQNELIEAITQKFLGHYEESRILLLQFTQNNPHIAEGFFRLAEIDRLTGRTSEALQAARQAVKLDPRHKYYRQFLAELLAENKLLKEAESEYEELCRQYPSSVEFLESLSELQIQMGKITDAVKTLEKLEALTGQQEKIQLKIYGLFMTQGRYKDAYRTAEKLLGFQPNNPRYHGMAADACKAMANESCRLSHLNAALSLDSLNPQAQMALALKALEEKDINKAFRFLEKAYDNPALSLDEKMLSWLGLLENSSVMPAHNREVFILLGILKKNYPLEAKVWSAEGDFYMTVENLPAALNSYRTTIALDRARMPIWRQVLLLCLETGQFNLTLAYADSLLELNPVAVDPLLAKALAYVRTGQTEKAVQTLSAATWALEDNPAAQARSLVIKAELEARLGQPELALKLLEEARRLDPKSFSALVWEARLRCLSADAAPRHLAELRQMGWTESSSTLMRAVVALCLARNGNSQEAQQKIRELENSDRYLSPLTLEILGEAALASGDNNGARSLWEKVLERAPEYTAIKEKLKNLKP